MCMGYETKHKQRDLEIPNYRQKLMSVIEADLIKDKNVRAVFYGGSIGKQQTDLYSDIDLRIVVKDEMYEDYRKNKKQRAKSWGNVLFFEDFPWTTYSIAHYEGFLKVDSFYFKINDLQPSVWLQHIKIIHDATGVLPSLLEKSKRMHYEPTVEEFERWRGKCFAYIHETYRRVMRNERYYALQCLDHLRLSIILAWHMEAGTPPNTFGDWAKLEGPRSFLSESQLMLLEHWHSSREPRNIMIVLKMMFPEFKRVHNVLCHNFGLPEDPDWVDRLLDMV